MNRRDPGRAAFAQILDDYRNGIKRAGPVPGAVTESENKIRLAMSVLLAALVALGGVVVALAH